jgi:hypothetical protein
MTEFVGTESNSLELFVKCLFEWKAAHRSQRSGDCFVVLRSGCLVAHDFLDSLITLRYKKPLPLLEARVAKLVEW